MTYGPGQSPNGWPPPSGPGPRPPGRRRAPEEDGPPPGYEERTSQAPAPPPVAEPPRRSRRPDPDPGPLTDRYVPRRAAADPVWMGLRGGRGPMPLDRDGRGEGRRHAVAAPVPAQWGTPPGADPDTPPPDERAQPRRGASGRRGPAGRRGSSGSGGQPDGRHTSAWLTTVGVLAVAILAGVCAAGGYIMLRHPGAAGDGGAGSAVTQPTARDISNRAADPAPLTEAELFPGKAVGGYPLVKTQATPDCAGVAIGEPAKILAGAGCTQMVRATLLSPDKVYVVTAGLVNLESEDRAQQANEGIRTAVGAQKGRFTGFVVSGVSEVFTTAATQLGWDVRGHFLGYCVVARADGKPLDGNDPGGRRIIDDLVEKYLIGTVVQARVSPPSSAPAPAGRTGAPKPSATRK